MGAAVENPLPESPVRVLTPLALAAGGLVLGGFVVLAGFAALSPRGENLPGLLAFPSAYVGDSVLLPLAILLLIAGAQALPPARTERAVTLVAGLLGAAGALLTQLMWLHDNHPQLNWTLPEPHYFTAAGKWHAAYAVVTAGILTAALAAMLIRVGGARALPDVRQRLVRLLAGPGSAAVCGCLLGYAVLAVRDSISATLASQSSIVALATAALALVIMTAAAAGMQIRALCRPALFGVLAAIALGLAAQAPWSTEYGRVLSTVGVGLVGVGVALALLIRDLNGNVPYRPELAWAVLVGLVSPLFLTATWTLSADAIAGQHWPQAAAWSGGFVVALILLPLVGRGGQGIRWLNQGWDVLAVFAALGGLGLLAVSAPRWREDNDLTRVLGFLTAVLIVWRLFPIMRRRFDLEVREEKDPAGPDGSYTLPPVSRRAARFALLLVVVSGAAAIFLTLAVTLATMTDVRYLAGSGIQPKLALLAGVGLVACGFAALLGLGRARVLRWASALVAMSWPVTLVFVGTYRLNLFALLGGLLLALWTLNSVICNSALLRLRRVDAPLWVAAGLLTASAGLSGYAALTFVLAEPPRLYSWAGGVCAGVLILAVQAALSVIVGRLAAPPASEMTRHDLGHNLIQDATLVSLLYVCAGLIPSVAWAHLPTELGDWARSLAVAALCLPFMMFFLSPYRWLLDNNLRHLDSETTTRADDPATLQRALDGEKRMWARNQLLWRAATRGLDGGEQERFLRVLAAHIRNQNLIGSLIVILSVAGMLVLMNKDTVLGFARRDSWLDRTGGTA